MKGSGHADKVAKSINTGFDLKVFTIFAFVGLACFSLAMRISNWHSGPHMNRFVLLHSEQEDFSSSDGDIAHPCPAT